MVHRNLPKGRTSPLSESLVDGLLQGMAAGVAALVVLLIATILAHYSPLFLLRAFGVPGQTDALQGLLSHLAMSAIYGILWALGATIMVQRRSEIAWRWVGLAYGLALWGVGEFLVIESTGIAYYHWFWVMIAHLLYGGTLGMLQQRQAQARD